jgi:hypothetical protein
MYDAAACSAVGRKTLRSPISPSKVINVGSKTERQ